MSACIVLIATIPQDRPISLTMPEIYPIREEGILEDLE